MFLLPWYACYNWRPLMQLVDAPSAARTLQLFRRVPPCPARQCFPVGRLFIV